MTMTIKAQKELARDVRILLGHVECQDSTARGHIDRAITSAKRGEREHRDMGRRFTNGQCGYRLPIVDTAWIFVGRAFVEQLYDKTPLTGPGIREDIQNAYFAAQAYRAAEKRAAESGGPYLERFHRTTAILTQYDLHARLRAWDYAEDCAR